jgi:hypothetical protein
MTSYLTDFPVRADRGQSNALAVLSRAKIASLTVVRSGKQTCG